MFPMMPYGQNYGYGTAQQYSNMYPNSYNIINPVVEDIVSRMDENITYIPTQENIDRMEDAIFDVVNGQISDDFELRDNYDDKATETAQFGRYPTRQYSRRPYRRRTLLRDFIRLLLLRQLFRRRGNYYY